MNIPNTIYTSNNSRLNIHHRPIKSAQTRLLHRNTSPDYVQTQYSSSGRLMLTVVLATLFRESHYAIMEYTSWSELQTRFWSIPRDRPVPELFPLIKRGNRTRGRYNLGWKVVGGEKTENRTGLGMMCVVLMSVRSKGMFRALSVRVDFAMKFYDFTSIIRICLYGDCSWIFVENKILNFK